MELNREQIVKALECCIYEKPCRLCPLNDYSHDADGCKRELMKHALIIIRDQDKELFEAHNKNVELVKENAQLKFFDLVTAQQDAEYFEKQYLKAKADTVMDFAERLLDTKSKICNDYYILADNVLVLTSKMLTEGGGEQ